MKIIRLLGWLQVDGLGKWLEMFGKGVAAGEAEVMLIGLRRKNRTYQHV